MNLKTTILYQLYFEMPQAISKFTMVNADVTTKEYSEQSERMRHLFVKSVLLLVITVFLSSCEDVVQIQLSDENVGLYAVEAKITTDNNPYVYLYKSQLVSSDSQYPGVSGAEVVISDNSQPQERILLQESQEVQGLYVPKQGIYYWGERGKEYTLTITVKNVTMTATELLAPVEPLDSIQVRPSNRGDYTFLGILTYGKETPGMGNYYKWDIYINRKLLYPSDYLVIATDELVDGNYIDGLEIYTDFHDPSKPEDRFLNLGDTIQVRQNSISKFAYYYYYQMFNQGQNGGLFSVPTANIKGNITSSDGREVLGLFIAQDVSISNTVIIDETIENGLKK